MARINRVAGDVFRDTIRIGGVEPKALDALRHAYGEHLAEYERDWLIDMTSEPQEGMVMPPGAPLATVTKVVKVEPGCVTLEAILDFSYWNAVMARKTSPATRLIRRLPRTSRTSTVARRSPGGFHHALLRLARHVDQPVALVASPGPT